MKKILKILAFLLTLSSVSNVITMTEKEPLLRNTKISTKNQQIDGREILALEKGPIETRVTLGRTRKSDEETEILVRKSGSKIEGFIRPVNQPGYFTVLKPKEAKRYYKLINALPE